MTDLELATATHHTSPASPTVWILSRGEIGDGGNVLGVYATKDAAKADFLKTAADIPFSIDKAWQDDDGAVHVEGGCDFVDLEPHTVFTAPQLTA